MDNHNNVVKNHTVKNGDILIFEFLTFEEKRKSQFITCGVFEDLETFANKQFLVTSEVGDIYNEDGLDYALLLSDRYPFLNISMDEDNMISVRACLDVKLNKDLLFSNIMIVAKSADYLEQKLFGWDMK